MVNDSNLLLVYLMSQGSFKLFVNLNSVTNVLLTIFVIFSNVFLTASLHFGTLLKKYAVNVITTLHRG